MTSPVDIPDWSGSGLNGTQLQTVASGYRLAGGATQTIIAAVPGKTIVLYHLTLMLKDNTGQQIFWQDTSGGVVFQYTSNAIGAVPHPYGGLSLPQGAGLVVHNAGGNMTSFDNFNLLYLLI